MIDVAGLELTGEDIHILQHPLVGGVILFARNYHDKAQVSALCAHIRNVCPRPVLLAVDQEGGACAAVWCAFFYPHTCHTMLWTILR